MTKEEKIQEAYGEYYIKDNIDEYGWTNSISQGFINSIPCDGKEMHIVYGKPEWWYRPKSLSGIENNNGWIKIENVDDLPVQTVEYHIIKKGLLSKSYYYGNNRWTSDENTYPRTTEQHGITHYQPIIKPKPPIY